MTTPVVLQARLRKQEGGLRVHDSIHSALPIRRAAVQVGNGHDQNALRILGVNHAFVHVVWAWYLAMTSFRGMA